VALLALPFFIVLSSKIHNSSHTIPMVTRALLIVISTLIEFRSDSFYPRIISFNLNNVIF
jgi:hypothetical protein